MEASDVYSMGRQNWFEPVGDEHHHVRNQVGLFDQSSFAKYEMRGRDAAKLLDYICANDMSKRSGQADLHATAQQQAAALSVT